MGIPLAIYYIYRRRQSKTIRDKMCCCSKAGKKTYKAYQQRQMAEQARSSAYGTTLQPEQYNHGYSPDSLSIKANAEITEKDGLEPPAYSDVVGEHAVINDQATSSGQSGSSSTSSEYTPSERRHQSKWQLKLLVFLPSAPGTQSQTE